MEHKKTLQKQNKVSKSTLKKRNLAVLETANFTNRTIQSNPKKFFSHFREALNDLIKRPAIIFAGLALWVLITLLSNISVKVNHSLTSSVHIIGWLIGFGFVSLAIMGFVFSGIIGWSERIIKKKKFSLNEFFSLGKKFWSRNFEVIVMILLISILIGRVSHFLATGIGDRFNLAYGGALLIFVLVYFIGLVALLIWMTFSNFMVVMKNMKAWQGVRASAAFVKKEYLATLALNVIMFVAFWLTRDFEGVVFELIEYGLIIPYLSLLLVRFVLGK